MAPKMDAREARKLRSKTSSRREEPSEGHVGAGGAGTSFWRTGEPGDGSSGMTLSAPAASPYGRTSAAAPAGRTSTAAPAGRPSAAASSKARAASDTPAADGTAAARGTQAPGTASASSQEADGTVVKVRKEAPKKPYRMPSTNLLHSGPKAARAKESELRATAIKLQQTLASYGVGVTVTNVSCGPTVTRYELKPDQGVRVNQVLSRVDDIQLNLAAAEIRIEAPIPGKSAIGIEVPNAENQTVYLKELVDSQEFRRATSKVCFAVGRDISGRVIVADIDRMPHLLIAGATGSGKSVCINTIIMSILFKAKPDEVRMIMIDPKVVELSVYNGIPHLMIPVVTDPKKAAGALQWAVTEMANRYKTFAKYNVRDIVSYNRLATSPDHEEGMEFMPRILIIVDELADLMMVSPKEVEGCIQRLAQLARAAGLHLILATQRPSVNVITGVIKANVPSRLAFAVSSSVDSRTILDMGGAEKLLGKGDMLFHLAGWPKPVRIQGAFVSDSEILDVVNFLKDQTGEGSKDGTDSQRSLITQIEAGVSVEDGQAAEERDELFERCGLFLIEKGKGTSNILQRTFRIGFNRAARILDQLTEAGVLGPDEGTKPRQVLMTKEEFEEMLEGGE
jgi:S-DNA-T family DNA segregation ATPase FtsK/SpoIIIE